MPRSARVAVWSRSDRGPVSFALHPAAVSGLVGLIRALRQAADSAAGTVSMGALVASLSRYGTGALSMDDDTVLRCLSLTFHCHFTAFP